MHITFDFCMITYLFDIKDIHCNNSFELKITGK